VRAQHTSKAQVASVTIVAATAIVVAATATTVATTATIGFLLLVQRRSFLFCPLGSLSARSAGVFAVEAHVRETHRRHGVVSGVR
jgi:hypothetical protein